MYFGHSAAADSHMRRLPSGLRAGVLQQLFRWFTDSCNRLSARLTAGDCNHLREQLPHYFCAVSAFFLGNRRLLRSTNSFSASLRYSNV